MGVGALLEKQSRLTRVPVRTIARRLWRNRLGVVGGGLLALLLVLAFVGPALVQWSPRSQDLSATLRPPSKEHLLGTDQFGRDLLIRTLIGMRMTLLVGLASTLLGAVVGSILGVVAGYFRGVSETLVMRAVDVMLAFPSLILAMVVFAILGPGVTSLIFAVGVYTIPTFARVSRGEVLRIAHQDYVSAARGLGARSVRVLLRYVAPNISPVLVSLTTLRLGTAVLVAASLGFLGLGVQPPTPELGSMLADGRTYMRIAVHLTAYPGMAILLLVLSFNLLGEWLLEALDPRIRASGTRFSN